MIGLNELYDMRSIIREPGEKHAHLQRKYKSFTRLGLGDDEKVWHTMCPISVSNWKAEWCQGHLRAEQGG